MSATTLPLAYSAYSPNIGRTIKHFGSRSFSKIKAAVSFCVAMLYRLLLSLGLLDKFDRANQRCEVTNGLRINVYILTAKYIHVLPLSSNDDIGDIQAILLIPGSGHSVH